ncbi:MAG TPA: efflux RND transporter permease subunit, partial [Candidatus Paceibacterota bacterium]
LKTTPGVTDIEVHGGRTQQLNIVLDPDALSARGVDISDVIRAVQSNDAYAHVGSLESASGQTEVVVDGDVYDKDTLGRTVVGGSPESPVYLSDVADVEAGYDTQDHEVSIANKDAATGNIERPNVVYLSFAKAKGTNITAVTAAAQSRIDVLKKSFVPDGITLSTTRDEGATAGDEIMKLTEHLFFAILIVTVTLVFFLGWRAALVVATAIPLTLALVFVIGYGFGESINRITLFALIFSLGLLVDDAIVVIENIHRHFSHKTQKKTDAIAHATGEVGTGVLLSTITAVAVFLPMGVVTGMMGAYMGPIAFFAPVARLASLFVAYSLSPYIASVFLREHTEEDGETHAEHYPSYVLRYKALIHHILDDRQLQNRILAGVLIAVVIAFSLPVLELVHFRMLPKANKEQFSIYLDLPSTASFAQTSAAAAEAEQVALKDKDVSAVEAAIGSAPVADFNGLFRGSDMRTQPSQATLKVDLVDARDRSRTSEVIATSVRAALYEEFANEPGVRIAVVEDPPGPPVLATLVARIKGPDPEVRDAIARDMLASFRATSGVTDIDSTLQTGGNQLLLTIDHEKVSRSGLSVAEVTGALTAAIGGEDVAMAHLGNREYTAVSVRFATSTRQSIDDLSRIELKNSAGALVPLSSVVSELAGSIDPVIWHDAREGMAMVTGEVEGRSVVYVVKDLIGSLLSYRLPDGQGRVSGWNLYGINYEDMHTHQTYRIEWGGEFEMTLDNFRDLGVAMLLSYFLIYVILVAQFRSFRSSALIMTTIILGFAGVMPGFAVLDALSGVYFSATSMIGAIALGGIVVGNAILLLDFIEQERARGISSKIAIVESCKVRLQPIMLTSITAVLGSAVIVTDPVWSGLAWALIFGLSLSTVLTLIIFPILYYRFGGVAEEE